MRKDRVGRWGARAADWTNGQTNARMRDGRTDGHLEISMDGHGKTIGQSHDRRLDFGTFER